MRGREGEEEEGRGEREESGEEGRGERGEERGERIQPTIKSLNRRGAVDGDVDPC